MHTHSQSDAKGKENIIQSLTTKSQDVVSDQDPQKTAEQSQVNAYLQYYKVMHSTLTC